jgi:hypothetical protein
VAVVEQALLEVMELPMPLVVALAVVAVVVAKAVSEELVVQDKLFFTGNQGN